MPAPVATNDRPVTQDQIERLWEAIRLTNEKLDNIVKMLEETAKRLRPQP